MDSLRGYKMKKWTGLMKLACGVVISSSIVTIFMSIMGYFWQTGLPVGFMIGFTFVFTIKWLKNK